MKVAAADSIAAESVGLKTKLAATVITLVFVASGTVRQSDLLADDDSTLQLKSATVPDHEWKILIRPANFDPAHEDDYTLRRGEIASGKATGGALWNVDDKDIQAVVSGNETPTAATQPADVPVPTASGSLIPRMGYSEAYNSVPFNRAEYEANPGYRHDAALEIMFGALRPTTIVRQTIPYFSRYPDQFRYRYSVYPYMTNPQSRFELNYRWNNWTTDLPSY